MSTGRSAEELDTIADLEELLVRAAKLLKQHRYPRRRAFSRWELQAADLLKELARKRPDLDAHAERRLE